jgi:hypothetical protein
MPQNKHITTELLKREKLPLNLSQWPKTEQTIKPVDAPIVWIAASFAGVPLLAVYDTPRESGDIPIQVWTGGAT